MKDALRSEIRVLRGGMKPLVRAQEEDLVNAAIISDPDWALAGVVAVYKAVGSELSLVSVTGDAWRRGKTVCFPRVGSGGVSFHAISGWDQLVPGAHGIPEPNEGAPLVAPATIDIALVPGIAWTERGERLGQGGGYYDRLLPQLGGVSWGVGFDCQMVSDIPMESHDRPVDRVIWPTAVLSGAI